MKNRGKMERKRITNRHNFSEWKAVLSIHKMQIAKFVTDDEYL